MGQHDIQATVDDNELRTFVKALLEDVQALELMLREGMIESGVRRIGAEQELFLVDSALRPTNKALRILERLGDDQFTTELGLFNMEANLHPQVLEGRCLSRMETELTGLLAETRVAAESEDARIVLTGILPTLGKEHLQLDSMTPNPRYFQLNRIMRDLRGGEFRTLIKGLDELQTSHDNVMLEACNTSFQVHFQVASDEFANLYNLAQLVTAPVLAAAVNSPVLLQHRLWQETRVALFQQSLDTRSATHTLRGGQQRVNFGDRWIDESVLEIFREDIARFRVLVSTELEESPLAKLERGEIPALRALCLHNGTVYRWNRPCYGVGGGKPHLRIENRVLPAGPTPLDEIANAAFFFGLMCAFGDDYDDVRKVMAFDDAKANFLAAARNGLDARFRWIGGRTMSAEHLILSELLPAARRGLLDHGLDAGDVERYLSVIAERVAGGRTGAQWALDSLAAMGKEGTPDTRHRSLVASMAEHCLDGEPVHTWPLAELDVETGDRAGFRTVGQMMITDLFTVHPEDLVDLAASLMDWEHIRHVPVEDNEGRLVGLVTHRQLLRMLGGGTVSEGRPVPVRDVMTPDPLTGSPDMSCLEAIEQMRANGVSCLPIVKDEKLVGLVTESDFMGVAARLLDRWLRE
jgi:CBS domain-containing protein